MSLTVGVLKKALKGIKDSTPVYLADFDHSEWETSSMANYIQVINQEDLDNHAKKHLEKDKNFKIEGEYVVIRGM